MDLKRTADPRGDEIAAESPEFLLVLHGDPALLALPDFNQVSFMSQHRSLRSSSTIAAKRNVLKRFERVDLLKKRGQWKEGRSVMNLPKTKPDA
jgi:small basic protein (TIGR04137 family)